MGGECFESTLNQVLLGTDSRSLQFDQHRKTEVAVRPIIENKTIESEYPNPNKEFVDLCQYR
jgi:hypothetical protein